MAELDLSEITDGKLGGTGIFDKLMAASAAHIQNEFAKNRVKGPEYAALYTAGIQTAMDQSIRYALEWKKSLLIDKQIELADAQLIQAAADLRLTEKNIEKITKDITKITAEISLINKNIEVAEQNRLTTIAQTAKINSEKDLLAQKLLTERAQTQSGIASDTSVIGKQNALYTAQTNGYARDAEQKLLKIVTDTWSLRHTNEPELNTANSANKLVDGSIGTVLGKAATGIGVNL